MISIPSQLVRLWGGPEQFNDSESIIHWDWQEHNLWQRITTLDALHGWNPYSGFNLDCAACSAALDEVEAWLTHVDRSSGKKFPRSKNPSEKQPPPPSPQESVECSQIRPEILYRFLNLQSAKLKAKELSAVLYGLGNYAKTIILPNTPRGVCIKSIHEIDTTQIGPNPSSHITWSTAPYPAPDDRADVYFIAGFHHTHAPIAIHALRHDAVAVVEKPICTTHSQLEELLEAMHGGGKLYACFHKRYLPFNDFAFEDLGQRADAPINYHCIVYEVPLPALHWYNWPNSCTRLVSNGCHWIDHFLYLNRFSSVQSASVKPFTNGSLNVTIELMNGAVFTMTLTDEGSQRVGVQDYIELRANDVTVKMTNGSEYQAEGRNRILRRKRINKMLTYHLMYRTIGQHILDGKPGDSLESVACSTGVILDLEDQLKSFITN
ncbi:Gfo/Idh/MocA family oxidoreductase [Desulforhabdus amnigena]|nr:Gfo/Idh/MocA family oxidoreductase [Desulforhabdus amnigena]